MEKIDAQNSIFIWQAVEGEGSQTFVYILFWGGEGRA